MAKWFYYKENNEKIEITGSQLKGLAKAGVITPDTMVETEGKTAPARKVTGLTFLAATQPETKISESASTKSEIYGLSQAKPPVEAKPPAAPPVSDNPFTTPGSPASPSVPINPLPPRQSVQPQTVPQSVGIPAAGKYAKGFAEAIAKPFNRFPVFIGIGALLLVFVVVGVGISFVSDKRITAKRITFTAAEQKEIDWFLEKYGDNLDVTYQDGSVKNITMLHNAARDGNFTVVKYLVSKGLDVQAGNSAGETPLHYAVREQNVEIAEFLISRGADVNAGNTTPLSSLLLSASSAGSGSSLISDKFDEFKGKKMLELFIAHKAEVPKDAIRRILDSSSINQNEWIRILAANGADVNAKYQFISGDDFYFPIHKAVEKGHETTIGLLLSFGADINVQDSKGNTPLHIAVLERKSNIAEIVQLLVSRGANVNIKNNEDKLPLDIVKEKEKGVDNLIKNAVAIPDRIIFDYKSNLSKVRQMLSGQ